MKNKKKKIRIGIIFGGKSAEHEVSLQSAKNIIDAMDKEKYDITLIGIDKSGKWYRSGSNYLLNATNPKLIKLNSENNTAIIPAADNSGQLISLDTRESSSIDVVFPVLHGTFGEDGTIQGLLKLAGIPFVGASVLGSAIGMDKDVMKRLFQQAGLPTANFLAFEYSDKINFGKVKKALGMPLFVKPANLGSSVGVSKVRNEKEFKVAVKEAFKYDNKILVEQFIKGREIECSVLGNKNPKASIPGEVLPKHDFYSYEAKYIDENGAALEIPAKLSKAKVKEIQDLAVKGFKALCLEGMARVDFFLTNKGKVYINEANTIPGFTKISMYPKLWEASGLSYTELIDQLVELAIERFDRESKLKTGYV
jgi:D-alanine-D-alanine ligase